jgi:hypothetical protein
MIYHLIVIMLNINLIKYKNNHYILPTTTIINASFFNYFTAFLSRYCSIRYQITIEHLVYETVAFIELGLK